MLHHIRRWREKRGVAAMAQEMARHEQHEILDFIDRHYPELKDRRKVTIGLVGGIYRVAVIDQFRVSHTLKIDPKRIDEDQIIRARMDGILDPRPTVPEDAGRHSSKRKNKDHDLER